MKVIYTAVLIVVSAFAMHFANSASSPDRPAGVDAQNWIAVSDKMGFVVTTPHIYPPPVTDPQALLPAAPAEGYFMVHTGNVWQRLTIKDPLKGPGRSG
jgi:hypothetical protein